MVRVQYDPGLEAIGIPNPVEIGPLERILPGETQNLPPLSFRASQGGTQCFNLEISSAGGDTARARRCVQVENVMQPQVRVDMESHRTVQVGQQVLVRMKVTNVGSLPLDDVSLINSFSRSMTPVGRSPLPQRWLGDDLVFDLGRLEPNQEAIVEVLYDTNQPDGDAFSRAAVTTPLGASDQTGVTIRIEPAEGAIPVQPGMEGPIRIPDDPTGNLRVNVTAFDRTIAVNNEARFQVTVQNNRSVPDQQIEITLLVPPGTQLLQPDLSQTGLRIRDSSPDGTQFRFEPRQEMRAGETLTFNITLRAIQPGEATFVVQAVSARSPAVEGRDTITIVP